MATAKGRCLPYDGLRGIPADNLQLERDLTGNSSFLDDHLHVIGHVIVHPPGVEVKTALVVIQSTGTSPKAPSLRAPVACNIHWCVHKGLVIVQSKFLIKTLAVVLEYTDPLCLCEG